MPTKRNANSRAVKFTLLAASAISVLAGSTLAPALPAMRENFSDVPNVDLMVRLVLTVPALFIGILAPFAGLIVDKIGRKRVLVVSILVGGLAGISGFFAPTLGLLLAGRAILGMAVAGSMTSATTLIADYYEGPARSGFLGLQAGVLGLGGTVVFSIAGILADFNWRTPFLVYLVPFIVLPLAALVLFEPRHDERCGEDVAALGDVAACAAAAAREDQSFGFSTAHKEPIPYGLLGFIYAVVLLIMICYFTIPIQLPFYLKDVAGASGTRSGLSVALAALSYALSAIFLSKRMTRFDHFTVLLLGFSMIGIGLSLITMSGGSALMYLGLVSAGSGVGIAYPNLYVWLANGAPLAIRGRALGGMNTGLFLSQFLSPIIAQPVATAFTLERTFILAGILLLAVAPIIFASRGRLRTLTASPA